VPQKSLVIATIVASSRWLCSLAWPNEVDEAMLDVGVDEFDAYPITNIEALEGPSSR